MKNLKLLKTVLAGNIVLNVPFALILFYFSKNIDVTNSPYFLAAFGFTYWIYWSFMSVWYRTYSIKQIENKTEYYQWKKISVHSLLLWPDNFILTRTELWDDKKSSEYQKKVSDLKEV